MFLTAITVKTRDPDSQTIGDYKESWTSVYQVWEREIERIYGMYKSVSVKASEYRHIDESKRYPEG